MTDDGVDETGNGKAVEKIANEASATDHCARGNGRASIGEGKLEKPDGEKCYAGAFVGCRHTLQEEPVITNEAVAVAKHEREAEGVEQQAAQAGVNHALHENVDRLTRTAEAGLQHGEADLHAEDQERRDQSPRGIDRVHSISGFDFGRGGLSINVGKEHARDHGYDQQHQTDSQCLAT